MPYSNDPAPDAEADEIVRREAAKHGLTETKYRMMKAAPTDVVQSIVWDHVGRADVNRPSSMIPPPRESSAPEKGSGWAPHRPIRPPEGLDHIDRMVETQTAKERLQTAQEQVRAAIELQKYNELMREKREREQKE
jgi:hypothetical protein